MGTCEIPLLSPEYYYDNKVGSSFVYTYLKELPGNSPFSSENVLFSIDVNILRM